MTVPRSVLHLIRPRPAGEIGGADLHIADLAEAQASRGLDVTVVNFGNPEYSALLRERSLDAVEAPGPSMRAWHRAASHAAFAKGPEIVHSHGYRADVIAAMLRWGTYRAPHRRPGFVMTSHGFIRTSPAFRAMNYINEWCLWAADVVVTTSRREALRLSGKGYDAVRFIPNGIRHTGPICCDYPAERLGIVQKYVVAFVGRMSAEKRPDLVLHMARLMAPEHPDAIFLLIGDGPMSKSMHRLASRLGVAGQVRFAGLRRDVSELLHNVNVLVCPSDSEGTPRAVIEAMAAGVPVVATSVGGLPDLVTGGVTGVLVEPGSAEHLAAAVHMLRADPGMARALGKAGAAHASKYFTAERMERQVADAYIEAIRLAEGLHEIQSRHGNLGSLSLPW